MSNPFSTPKCNNKLNESNKENQAPCHYRSHSSFLSQTIDFDDKDLSVCSDISYVNPSRTNTSQINDKIRMIDVNSVLKQQRQRLMSEDQSEISFDIQEESLKVEEGSSDECSSKPGVTQIVTSSTNNTTTSPARRHPFNDSNIDHFPHLSPNDFNTKDSSTAEFKWSIDHIAELNPAEFNEDQPSYILEEERKLIQDKEYQERTQKYFATSCIAPSPLCSANKSSGFEKQTQTNISLPSNFNLEALLGKKYLVNSPTCSVRVPSEASYRRMLFNDRTPAHYDTTDKDSDTQTDIEELAHSPQIMSVHCSPLSSDNSPSYIIANDNELLASDILSPIENSRLGTNSYRTPGRVAPGGGSGGSGGPSVSGIAMSTPGYNLVSTPGMAQFQSPASSLSADEVIRRKKTTPDSIGLFKSSPFISPIPPKSQTKRHPKCPKRSRVPSPDGKKVKFKVTVTDTTSTSPQEDASMMSVGTPSLSSPTDNSQNMPAKIPMESSRIESGNDESSLERLSPKILMQGIQPLDISEIKPMDLTKLRTNNFLDISEPSPGTSPSSGGESDTPNTDKNKDSPVSTSPWVERSTGCEIRKDDTKSKDSGFGTSSAMSTMTNTGNFDTLPPLSEIPMENILAIDSRPGKRKLESSPGAKGDASPFYPPPIKRLVKATPSGTVVTTRRKHQSE